jgi:hypothetical protein
MVASQLVVVTIQVPPAHHQIIHADNFGIFQDLGSVLLFLVPYFRLAATDDPATDSPATGGPATDGPATGDIHMTQRQCDNDQLLPVPEEVEYSHIVVRAACSSVYPRRWIFSCGRSNGLCIAWWHPRRCPLFEVEG